jgi:hypothetical protein
MMFRIGVLALLVVPATLRAQAGNSRSGALFDELARMDSVLFDAAFSSCNYARVDSLLAADVEFYHDVNGMHTDTAVRADFKRLTGNCPGSNGVRRELVGESLEVYPISSYGAIQMGVHRFTTQDTPTYTIARFIHLWKREANGRWVLTRVMSFDHRTAQ